MGLEKSKPKHRKGLWSPDEDQKLRDYVLRNGHGSWSSVPAAIGLHRNGKSCRLRWINYLRPGLKRGTFTKNEEELILSLHRNLGNKWSRIAEKLPGRTDNEIKNHWHTHMKKRSLTKVSMTESQELDSMSINNISSIVSPNGSSHNKEGVRGLMPKVIFEEWLCYTKLNPFDDDDQVSNNVFNGSTFMDDDEVMFSLDEGSLDFESGDGWPPSYGVVSYPDCLSIDHGSSSEFSDLGSSGDHHGMCRSGFNQIYNSDVIQSSKFES